MRHAAFDMLARPHRPIPSPRAPDLIVGFNVIDIAPVPLESIASNSILAHRASNGELKVAFWSVILRAALQELPLAPKDTEIPLARRIWPDIDFSHERRLLRSHCLRSALFSEEPGSHVA